MEGPEGDAREREAEGKEEAAIGGGGLQDPRRQEGETDEHEDEGDRLRVTGQVVAHAARPQARRADGLARSVSPLGAQEGRRGLARLPEGGHAEAERQDRGRHDLDETESRRRRRLLLG
jgi:hypothetical protein